MVYINLYKHVFLLRHQMNYSNKRTKVVRIKGQSLFTANIHFLVVVFSYYCLSSIFQRVISAVSMHTTFASLSGSKPFADVIQILVGKSLNKYLIAMKVLI